MPYCMCRTPGSTNHGCTVSQHEPTEHRTSNHRYLACYQKGPTAEKDGGRQDPHLGLVSQCSCRALYLQCDHRAYPRMRPLERCRLEAAVRRSDSTAEYSPVL